MKTNEIENTLKKIIEIEEQANHMQERIDGLREVKEKELKKKQKSMDMEYIKAARKKGKKKKDHILMETEKEVKDLLAACEKEQKKLNYILEHHKDGIVEEVFKQLFYCSE